MAILCALVSPFESVLNNADICERICGQQGAVLFMDAVESLDGFEQIGFNRVHGFLKLVESGPVAAGQPAMALGEPEDVVERRDIFRAMDLFLREL